MADTTERFVNLFLSASRKLERILVQLHPLLTVDQSYVLAEIQTAHDLNQPITAQEISAQLRIEKSTLSRLLSRLADAHMVHFVPNPLDRRERFLSVTEVGQKFLARDSAIRDRQIEDFAANLSSQEITRLAALLRTVADNLGEPALPARAGAHPLKPEIRRLTRAMGFLGGNIFGSPVGLEEAQMLSLLSSEASGLPRMLLKENLPYDQTRISRLLTKYEEEGLLARAIHPEDRRQFIISLSPQGKEHLNLIFESARRLFERGLRGISAQDQQQFIALLENVVAAPTGGPAKADALSEGIVLLRHDYERKQARAFLIDYLARHDLMSECGETLIGHGSRTYGLVESGQLRVIMEAVNVGVTWRIEHFAEDSAAAPAFDVFVALCRDLFVRHGARRIDIKSVALSRKFSASGSSLSVDANTWESMAMKLSSRRLDA